MKKLSKYFLIMLCFLVAVISCRDEEIKPEEQSIKTERVVIPNKIEAPTIKKGYYGQVIKWERVLIPDPNQTTPDWGQGKEFPVNNDIYIYHSLHLTDLKVAEVRPSLPLYYINKIGSKPLYIITPNNKGFYQIDLPKGKYTALIKADSSTVYINGAGPDGQEGPFNVGSDALIKRDLKFDIEQLLR